MPLNKTEYIWFNGKWVGWDEATVHVTAHALHYGSSVFEGIRAYATPDGPAIFCLQQHVDRLFRSCKIARIDLPYDPQAISKVMVELVDRNKHQGCYIRPLVFRGADGLGVDGRHCPTEFVILTMDWGRYLGAEAVEQGVNVMVSSWRRVAPDTFPSMAKIGGNYISGQFIAMEAKENGYDEGICLDVNGYVSEGSGENIFVVVDNVLHTPPLASSILGGITRQCVFALAESLGYTVREQLIPREMLYVADEIFFTGTAAEITPIRSVDHIQIGSGSRGPVTQQIQEQFFGITSGHLPDRFGWLTPVYDTQASSGVARRFNGR